MKLKTEKLQSKNTSINIKSFSNQYLSKKLFTLILILLGFIVKAQCISGNCDNGFGKYKYGNGATYEGYFKNSIENGKGIKQRKNNNFRIKVDSLNVNCWYIFINVNRTNLNLAYEFAILNYSEVLSNLRRNLTENDNAVKTVVLDNLLYRNNWVRLEE
jgi:hypothetical protein